jgi:hypothetical protein
LRGSGDGQKGQGNRKNRVFHKGSPLKTAPDARFW